MRAARTFVELRFTVAAMVIAALLFAQWAGLAHRIDHSPLASIHMDAQEEDHDQEYNHSCVAFDAAAVADAIGVPPVAAAPMAGARVLALWVAFASWNPPPALHFSSRAPPLS